METNPIGNATQIRLEPSPKWVRVVFNGEFIADSKRALLLFPGGPPYYFFPKEDVRMDLMEPAEPREMAPLPGKASFWTVKVKERIAQEAAWTYDQRVSESFDLSGYITFDWNQMDAWFEEDEEIYVHPHDPYKRIDILESTRRVQAIVLSEKVADTNMPILLFETGLPTRYYFPKLDVRMDLLLDSDTVTGCAYKGKAQYHSVKVGDKLAEDIAWYYAYPENEAIKIRGRIAFFNEHLDALIVDGEEQEKPKTPWSH